MENTRVFLQHGVIINDLKWLYYPETKMRLFVCGAYPEYQFIRDTFGYPEGYVQYLGLCRFDTLHGHQTDPAPHFGYALLEGMADQQNPAFL